MVERLELDYEYDAIDPLAAVDAIGRVLACHQILLDGFTLYEKKPGTFSRLKTALKKADRRAFSIRRPGFEFHFAPIWRYQLEFIHIKTEEEDGRIPWDEWVTELSNERLISARVADRQYEYWQNAFDPLQYTAEGRSYDHLPMVSNGLPAPLEKLIIDTSRNPGRRVLREGYVEAVGSMMWLGEAFWKITGADKRQVESAEFLKTEEFAPGVLRIQASDKLFSSDQGREADLQRKLRALLFPRSASSN